MTQPADASLSDEGSSATTTRSSACFLELAIADYYMVRRWQADLAESRTPSRPGRPALNALVAALTAVT